MNLKLAAFRSDLFCHISGPPGGRPLPLVMAGGSPHHSATETVASPVNPARRAERYGGCVPEIPNG